MLLIFRYQCYTPQWKGWSVWEDRSEGDGSSLNNRCGATQRHHPPHYVIASVAGRTIAKRMNFQPTVTSLQYKRTTTATTAAAANAANAAAAALYATTTADAEGGVSKEEQLQTSLSNYLSPFTIVFANAVVSSSNISSSSSETTKRQPRILAALEELSRRLGLPSVLELTTIERNDVFEIIGITHYQVNQNSGECSPLFILSHVLANDFVLCIR